MLRRGSAVARFLESRFQMLTWAWISVSCEYCVCQEEVSAKGPITCPEEPYRVAYLRVISKPQQCGSLGPMGQSRIKKKHLDIY